MADIELIIKIPEETVNRIKDNTMFAKNIADDIKWEVTSNEALEAAKVIQQYCRDHGKVDMHCKGCIFSNHICVLNDPDHLPETWELNKLGGLIVNG